MQLSPMKIGPLSATSTQPKPIEQFEPIVTSPQITDVSFSFVVRSLALVPDSALKSELWFARKRG
jgi:hypothetical protein